MTQTAIPVEPATICERCRERPAVHTHHRQLVSQGGDDSPENTVRVCLECHQWIHDNPRDAAAAGWIVLSWQQAAEVVAEPLEHDHKAVAPGERCPVCHRRVPKPKDVPAEPRHRATISVKVPADERENGAQLWDERIQYGRDLLCEAMGWEPDVGVYYVAMALFDKGLEAAKEDLRQMGMEYVIEQADA